MTFDREWLHPMFHDRREAGRKLAERLRAFAHDRSVVVLGMPRGGVPVAYEVARALEAPLDVYVPRDFEASEVEDEAYRFGRPPLDVARRTVILVDDGLAASDAMIAAARELREHRCARVVVAVPIASPDACAEVAACVDGIVCAHTPASFLAVGLWYEEFPRTTDSDVRRLLALDAARHPQSS